MMQFVDPDGQNMQVESCRTSTGQTSARTI
jgi:hypothetical protein